MTGGKGLNSKMVRGRILVLIIMVGIVLLSGSISKAESEPKAKKSFCTVLRTMARVYMAYGDYAKAQPLVERALTLARTNKVPDSELSLCLLDMAYIYNQQNRLHEAEQMCERI
ncbi:MAG: tetratricopeptide repeat protein [Planctomycetota bacterium]|jgi:Tfp pilus assembly protein PilF